jgi:acyl-coenzyme A thioesterase PaaI-like protein
VIAAEPVDRKFGKALKSGQFSSHDYLDQLVEAQQAGVISEAEAELLRRVHNHIGTVHAIALCNLAELAAGMMAEATVPADMRWIPKGMSVEYLKKAVGSMHGTATPEAAAPLAGASGEWPVRVEVVDGAGDTVFRARVLMWLSPRKRG